MTEQAQAVGTGLKQFATPEAIVPNPQAELKSQPVKETSKGKAKAAKANGKAETKTAETSTKKSLKKEATADEIKTAKDLVGKYGTKCAAMRELTKKGWNTGQIARAMGVLYQFVYNVQHRELKSS